MTTRVELAVLDMAGTTIDEGQRAMSASDGDAP